MDICELNILSVYLKKWSYHDNRINLSFSFFTDAGYGRSAVDMRINNPQVMVNEFLNNVVYRTKEYFTNIEHDYANATTRSFERCLMSRLPQSTEATVLEGRKEEREDQRCDDREFQHAGTFSFSILPIVHCHESPSIASRARKSPRVWSPDRRRLLRVISSIRLFESEPTHGTHR